MNNALSFNTISINKGGGCMEHEKQMHGIGYTWFN